MALTKLITDLIDGSLGTDWQATPKTADFTAVAGEGYFVNTTSTAITVTLPSSPSAGDEVSIVDYAGTADTNNITITSSDNINGLSNDSSIDYERGGVSLVYVDATQGWIVYNATNETDPSTFSLDYLVVAGGGSGGDDWGAGGGAGGLRTSYGSTSGGGAPAESSLTLNVATNYTVTVGSGGNDTNGSNSTFSSITSTGGGRGGANGTTGGSTGGSGGGGSYSQSGGAATSSPVQGYDGGNGHFSTSNSYATGGGGGAGVAGQNATAFNSGDGGNGLSVSITGAAVTYAGGGGGGAYSPYGGSAGVGGTGGGGAGSAVAAGTGVNGSANKGSGGGGGAGGNGQNGTGGSGVVVLRYPNTFTVTIGAGLTGSTTTDGSDKVTTFTAGTGTISFA